MNEQELANIQTSIAQLTSHALSLHYRIQAVIDFVDKKGGLSGASTGTINAYTALAQIHGLINNQAVVQGDYLATLTQNITAPQY